MKTVDSVPKHAKVKGELPAKQQPFWLFKNKTYLDSVNFTRVGNFSEFRFVLNQLDTPFSVISVFFAKL